MTKTRWLSLVCAVMMVLTLFASVPTYAADEAPLEIRIAYSDNPTLPFDPNWMTVKEIEKRLNVKITWEVIPGTEYIEKVVAMLNSGTAPDVVMYASTAGNYNQFALNGALVSMDAYKEQTPHFNALVEQWGLAEDIEIRRVGEEKAELFYLPALFDAPFYDGGPILRSDLLTEYGLEVPVTYEDLYNVAKVFKEKNPDSYPVTNLVDSRVTWRMTQPGWGISLGLNASTGTHVLSYAYDTKTWFPGATSDLYREYLKYMAKMFTEGLLDPEFANASDVWTTKLATGKAMISFAYYDQIGGLKASSTIEGIDFAMIPPLQGPAGAYHQPKSRTGSGPIFPTTTLERHGEEKFKKILSVVDAMFFSPENSELWCLGIEGETFTRDADGKVIFNEQIAASPDGPYKAMQLLYGCGADPLQLVWENAREMFKYDQPYAEINAIVAEMKGIQPQPPTPRFTTDQAEEITFIKAPLVDWFNVWTDDFIRGNKNVNDDAVWAQYVQEGKDLKIEEMAQMYNDVFQAQ